MLNGKVNPQARYSAVAEAVALADAEDKGEVFHQQNANINQTVVRRRIQQQPRPLSTVITDSVDCHNLNGHHDSSSHGNPFQRRKARPASMALMHIYLASASGG